MASNNSKSAPCDPDHCIQVRGACVHNLKNIDVDVPRNALVIFTGISGSGKPSLTLETLIAESQRRYLDSVSPYAGRAVSARPADIVRRLVFAKYTGRHLSSVSWHRADV